MRALIAIMTVALAMVPIPALSQESPVFLDEPFPDESWELVGDVPITSVPDAPGLTGVVRKWVSGGDEIFVTYVEGFTSQQARQTFMDDLLRDLSNQGAEEIPLPDFVAYDLDGVVGAVMPHGPGVFTLSVSGESRLEWLEQTVSWQQQLAQVDDLPSEVEQTTFQDEPFPDESWELVGDAPVSSIPEAPDLSGVIREWVSGSDEIFVTYVEGFTSRSDRQWVIDSLNHELSDRGAEETRLPNYRDHRAYDLDGVLAVAMPHGPGVLTVSASGDDRIERLERTVSWQRQIVPVDDLPEEDSAQSSIGWYILIGLLVAVAVLLVRQRLRHKRFAATLVTEGDVDESHEEEVVEEHVPDPAVPLPSPFLEEE